MTAKKKTEQESAKPKNFEKSLERLEKIVEEMESGELGLEKLMAHFEEGQTLVKSCSGKLNEVEKKIEKLVEKIGKLATEPFDAEEDEEEGEEQEDDDDLF